jgi:hypothetical protein
VSGAPFALVPLLALPLIFGAPQCLMVCRWRSCCRQLGRTSRKSSQTSTRAGLNQPRAAGLLPPSASDRELRPANYGVEHAVRVVHVVAADQLMSGVVRIHDVR